MSSNREKIVIEKILLENTLKTYDLLCPVVGFVETQ